MCGIYGRIGQRNDELDLRATRTLHHRGPDDAGLWIDTQSLTNQVVALGQTRLSIVDLSPAGHQPMLDDDGQVALVFNGEIYNFLTLRQKLEAQGRQFRSHSDTEVILHLYALHGESMLQMLEGMFAIALWDRQKKVLLLARDPTGIKPLHYRLNGKELTFASEIKALLTDPHCQRQPDVAALAGYLNYLYVPPPRTAFQGILQLLPGHRLVWQQGQAEIARFSWYTVTPKAQFASTHNATDQLENLLKEVVAEHMLADVPVGAFLSGGIDSALLVAMMARQRTQMGTVGPLQTFTVGFGQEGGGLDETARAGQIARHLGVAHEILQVDASVAADGLRHVVQQFDAPFANPTALLIDVLSQQARKTVTVAVTGDGGDESFGGYPRYRATWPLWAWQRLPETVRAQWLPQLARRLPEGRDDQPLARRLRRFLTATGGNFAQTYRDWLSQHTLPDLRALLTPDTLAVVNQHLHEMPEDLGRTLEVLAELPPGTSPLDAACFADVHGFLPDNVLALSDRMSMLHALELRVPFADRRVVDFGLKLPTLLKSTPLALLGSSGKHASKRLLRLVAARYVPDAVTNLPKQGFVAPMGHWLAGPLKSLADDALSPHRLRARGLVRPEAVAQMQAEHAAGQRDHTWHLWSLVVLEAWFQARIDENVALPAEFPVQIVVI